MRKKTTDKFYLYLFLSLLIHLGLILFFPLGGFNMLGHKAEGNNFGFIQVVEYQPQSSITSKVEEKVANNPEPKSSESKIEIEELKEEKAPEAEPEPQVEAEPPSKVETAAPTTPKVEPEPEAAIEAPEKNTSPAAEEIITSENSDLELNTNTLEENKATEDGENGNESNTTESLPEEEPAPAPPPPPSAGDLILGAPVPTYPKDLVGQALTGTVKIKAHVEPSGQLSQLELISSSGIEAMDRTALLTLEKGWQFKAYKQAYSLVIIIDYQLDAEGNPNVQVSQGELTFK